MPIPKIIHLIYSGKTLPEDYSGYLERIVEWHPSWQIKIYDDASARDIVGEHMPELMDVYDGYELDIQRADIFRLLVVYLFGGVYMDLDMLCLQNMDGLCDLSLVLGEEKTMTEQECNAMGLLHPLRVANYMFGGVARHPFLLEVIKVAIDRSGRKVGQENDVLETTGPGLLTDVYHQERQKYSDITLLPNKERKCVRQCERISCHFGDFAAHMHLGKWRWQQPANGKIVVLETYDAAEGCYDGLTHLHGKVRHIGEGMSDTSAITGAKVLVCGIPFLYERKLSPSNINIIYTTFESDRLPDFWVDSINQYYSHCIVPHAEVGAVFRNSGVKIPIAVIHQGFSRFERRQRRPEKKVFTVGFLGVPVSRKNLIKLYYACKKLKEGAIPELELAVHVSLFYDWLDKEQFEQMKMQAWVKWTMGKYDAGQVADWYSGLSCYVFPSSGEGWSYTPRESLYLGVPTILSAIPVHKELVESRYCRGIDNATKEPANFNGQVFGEWAQIKEEEIYEAIRDVYDNYTRYLGLAAEGAKWIADKWPDEDVQRQLSMFVHSL